MAFKNQYTTSVHGRRLGIQRMSTGETGGAAAAGAIDFLVGPEAVREGVTTSHSTGTDVPAHGVTFLNGTSAASSSVYRLSPPIPGVFKTIVFSSANTPIYLATKNGETFRTSEDSTVVTVIKSTLTGCVVHLEGLTTALWGLLTNGTSVISRSATT